MSRRHTSVGWSRLAVVAALLVASPAAMAAPSAPDVKEADALFNRALDLMDAGKSEEACPLLEKSHRLDPGVGTQYRIAECYENTARLLEARELFMDVANASATAGNLARDSQARARARAIEPKLSRLSVDAGALSDLPGTTLLSDGEPLGPEALRKPSWLSPGKHHLRVEAPGKAPWEATLDFVAGETQSVTIPALRPLAASPKPSNKTSPRDADDEAAPSRTLLYATFGAAGVATVVGTVFGIRTLSLRGAYEEQPTRERLDEGKTSGLVTDVAFGAALLFAGAGVFLLVTGDEPEAAAEGVSFSIQSQGAGVAGRLSF